MAKTLVIVESPAKARTIERILKDGDRDYYMSAIEAKEYGLIDDVVVHRKKETSPEKA